MRVRYRLRSRQWLQFVMNNPGRGAPYSIRDLAEAAGIKHHSIIGHLLTGERDDCLVVDAHAISEALGVAVLVLFAPPASPNPDDPSPNRDEE